jgi:O-methyltransferase involved in polyketide biosynthesis
MQINAPASDAASRDFSTVSPSAYTLLMMKGLTLIPYARQAAQLLLASRPDNADPINTSRPATLDTEHRPPLFWARVMHFENRYWSINQLMQSLPITNILELSSGFSFRGLALSREKQVFYIDTDLPELIATKRQFVAALTQKPEAESEAAATKSPETSTPETNSAPATNGTAQSTPETSTPATNAAENAHYELLPLNVLDAPAFNTIADHFPPGPLLIINEGLLVYLDLAEKEALCRTIKDILQRRGGYWITGDIYIQKELDPSLTDRDDSFQQFLKSHHVEEKKFEDFERAAEFFTRMGFVVDQEAIPDYSKLTALPHLLAALTPETQKKLAQTPKIHTVWRLRLAVN